MTRTATTRVGVPSWMLAVAAMMSVQLGSALSVGLIDAVGPAGTAWLRLTFGAVIFLAIARPPVRRVRRQDVLPLVGLGITTGLMTVGFLAAIERIPLGTAVAIEFLGPLTVAGIRSGGRAALLWPGLALVGVVLLTEPWLGVIDLAGVVFAVLSAIGWGAYILLTQRVGDRFSGVSALSFTVPIAAITAAVLGVPQAAGHLTWNLIPLALGLAVLVPVLPFALEMLALRRMTMTAFGTLMALEPAIGAVLGLIVLHQAPSLIQCLGVAIVVAAGAGAQYRGRGRRDGTTTGVPHPQLAG